MSGGAFYEPRPTPYDRELLPTYGLSMGVGWTFMERISLDFAYQYRWGERDAGGFDYDIKEHLFVASVITGF